MQTENLEKELDRILDDYDRKIEEAWDDPEFPPRHSFKAVQLAKHTHSALTEFKEAIVGYLKNQS